MTREDKDSLVEMLAKIPITETRGSLLSAIGKLLRVIDISESSIMIPTLLKDKCEFDAYEMLTLAKILKASILGHNDLVEFYMSESSSQLNSLAQQKHKQQINHSLPHNQYQLQQLSATPSLRSSVSDSTSTSISNSTSTSNSNSNLNSNSNSTSNSTSTPSTPIPSSTTHSDSFGTSSGASGHHNNDCRNNNILSIRQQQQQLRLNNGDPDATVRLLMQIEQLKIFIPQVTSLFESIIELYKNSVDTITFGTHK